jgi:uncharacterized protein YjiS (DUF1127 family)
MPKRLRKHDFAQSALRVVEESIQTKLASKSEKDRNQLMAEMGSIGGKIGGKRRAANMTPEQRRASASLAAKARWENSDSAEIKRQEGLRKIAQILEKQMTDIGLSEEEKNRRTELLMTAVEETVNARSSKDSSRSQESLHIAASRA